MRYGDASDDDGFEDCVGINVAGAAYVGADFEETSDGLLGGVFVGGGPPGVAPNESEPVLQTDVIDFDDDAVDTEIEIGSDFGGFMDGGESFVGGSDAAGPIVGFASPPLHGL